MKDVLLFRCITSLFAVNSVNNAPIVIVVVLHNVPSCMAVALASFVAYIDSLPTIHHIV